MPGCSTEIKNDEISIDLPPIASNIINHSNYLKKFGWNTDHSSGVIGNISKYDSEQFTKIKEVGVDLRSYMHFKIVGWTYYQGVSTEGNQIYVIIYETVDNQKIIGGHVESHPKDGSMARELLPITKSIKMNSAE